MVEPIETSVVLPVGPEHGFGMVTAGLATWWPTQYSWGPDVLDAHELEPREGGRIAEVSVHGNRWDWGRITTWDPPRRVVFDWQIGPDRVPTPDPTSCSEVEWLVESEGDGCRVTVVHRGFEVYGDAGGDYRAGLASEQGWSFILGSLVAAVRDGWRRSRGP